MSSTLKKAGIIGAVLSIIIGIVYAVLRIKKKNNN